MRWKEKRGGEASLEAAARDLCAVWRGTRAESSRLTLRRGREEAVFELDQPEGRFELLLLAILAGAKVQEATAVATFNLLREKGLTGRERLAAHHEDDEREVQDLLREHYRALANKAQKAEALFAAAARVTAAGGDVLGLHVPGQPWQKTLEALREFPHLKSRSYWYCREMARHGLWPDLEPAACAAVDTPVKLALWRLGFVGDEAGFLRDIPTGDCLRAVNRFFGGDTLPLFHQGDQLCRLGEARCAAICRVTPHCRLHGRRAENTEQPFALSTGTCG